MLPGAISWSRTSTCTSTSTSTSTSVKHLLMRTPFVVGNWKLHKTISEGLALVTELKNALAVVKGVHVGVAPTFVSINPIAKRLDDSARSKAIFGLLPKAAEKDGQRRYRLSGPLSSVQITGLK